MQNYLSFGKQRKEKGGFLPYIYARKWEIPNTHENGRYPKTGSAEKGLALPEIFFSLFDLNPKNRGALL
jgi:hypothetical protein